MLEIRQRTLTLQTMGITASYKGDIDATMRAFLAEVERQIIESLTHIGEEAVKIAREPHANDWQDQTGNLRSSIGYAVFKDGKQIGQSAFDTVPAKNAKKGTKQDGARKGLELAREVGSQYTDGYALVVVAGMNYAVCVESKGRDVLTSAEKAAEKQYAKEMADLVTNIKDAFK